jgi:hypothetical protein
VYIGVLASDTMNGIKEENNPDIPLFYSQYREFFIEAVKQIQILLIAINWTLCLVSHLLYCIQLEDVLFDWTVTENAFRCSSC